MAPLDGVVTKTTKGARPTTRVKRKGGLWYDPTFQDQPFHPKDVPDYITYANRKKQIAVRIIFNKSATRWGTLKPSEKECWCNRARDSGAKCGCFDFYMRSQLKAFMDAGAFDTDTCNPCPGSIIVFTSHQMSINQKQGLAVIEDGCSPYTWEVYAGGGTVSPTTGSSTLYTAPAQNSNCYLNATIRVTNYSGKYSDLKIAINAVQGLAIWSNEFNGTYPNSKCTSGGTVWRGRRINCDGSYGPDIGICSACNCVPTGQCIQDPTCSDRVIQRTCCAYANNCWPWPGYHPVCGISQCCEAYGDVRTPALKTAGCCPEQMLSPLFYPN